jgi:phosphoglycerol transferase MdoB-like AlkP superfamily enzyme
MDDGQTHSLTARRRRIEIALMVLISIANFYLVQLALFSNPFADITLRAQLYNMLLSVLFTFVLFEISGRLNVALQIATLVALGWAIGNYYLVAFRGTPVALSDFLCFGIASEVAGNYDYSLDTRPAFVCITLVTMAVFERFLYLRTRSKGPRRAFLAVAGACVLAVGLVAPTASAVSSALGMIDDEADPERMAATNGLTVQFFQNSCHGRVHMVRGYDEGEADEILGAYPPDASEAETDEQDDSANTGASQTHPNIIMVMNESFSDLAVVCDFSTNKDYMPYTHSLMAGADNTRSGNLDVSVLGGKTANSEFECLTGNSMFCMPRYSIPYLTYVRQPCYSLASYLEGYGYETIAMHPYIASGWRRDEVYSLLGFQQEKFLDDFSEENRADTLRGYMTDSAAYRQIIEEYESKPEGTPLFCFEVTIQNHSSYSANPEQSDFVPDITVQGTDDSETVGYLSLIERSDSALQELIDYFSQQQEPTIIVFFGDHQPSNAVVEPLLELNGMSVDDLDDETQRNRYRVPYVIWANYDIPEATGEELSANYLSVQTLRYAGLPTTGYFAYLSDLEQDYPVISSCVVRDAQGNVVSDTSGNSDLMEYRNLARYEVFGKK